MRVARVVGLFFVLLGLAGIVFGVARGLSFPYIAGGAALLIGVLTLLRAFEPTRRRRWVGAVAALVVLAGLIAAPGVLNASRNPVVAYAESEASWVSDGTGGGYALSYRSVAHLDESADVVWEQPGLVATWSTPDGLVSADDDRVQLITTSGEIAWDLTVSDLGGTDLGPVAWSDGVTTIAACDHDVDVQMLWPCSFVGIDEAGVETYRIDASFDATVYPGGLHYFLNTDGYGETGALPSHFGYADAGSGGPDLEEPSTVVADASDGSIVATIPRTDDSVSPAFAGDRVLTGRATGDGCTMSAMPLDGEAGWTTDVPCGGPSELSRPYFDRALLDGDVLWWKPDDQWTSDDGRPEDVGIDLATGESTRVGEVLWESLVAKDTSSRVLAASGSVVEVDEASLSVRDPFVEKPTWTTPLHGTFRSVSASSGVLAVVTKPFSPRLFASEDELQLEVYALDDGRLLGAQHFLPGDARDILALDNAALLVLPDGTSIRVG